MTIMMETHVPEIPLAPVLMTNLIFIRVFQNTVILLLILVLLGCLVIYNKHLQYLICIIKEGHLQILFLNWIFMIQKMGLTKLIILR